MTIVKEGWAYHSPDGTGLPWDTDPTMTSLYNFGYYPPDNSAIINKSEKYNAERIQQIGQYNTSINLGNKPNRDMPGNFGLINGLPIYWMLGKVSDSGGVKTISVLDGTARKPRLGIRQEIDSINYQTYMCTMHRLALDWTDNLLWGSPSWMAGKHIRESVITPSYSYPSNLANKFDVLTAMTWNSNSVRPTTFHSEMNQALTPLPGADGYDVEISEFTPVTAYNAMQFLGNEAENAGMIDDFDNGTTREFSWTVKQSADQTRYITYTGNGYLIDKDSTKGNGIQTFYNFNIWMTSLQFTVNDGLANALYGL